MYTPAILALIAAAAAAPTANFFPGFCRYNADFDDITVTNPTAPTQNVGEYDGLVYNVLKVSENVLNQGLLPHTPKNVAVFGLEGQLLQGTPNITTAGTSAKHFDLQQLYMGCTVASQESLVSIPLGCTMVFTGYNEEGAEIASREARFSGGSDMQLVEFGKTFEKVNTVAIALQGVLSTVAEVGVLDSLSYVVHT